MSEKTVQITITKNEAIVLHAFLSRIADKDFDNLFQDLSEQRVLWDMECVLEGILTEPFSPNYSAILQEARNKVKRKR